MCPSLASPCVDLQRPLCSQFGLERLQLQNCCSYALCVSLHPAVFSPFPLIIHRTSLLRQLSVSELLFASWLEYGHCFFSSFKNNVLLNLWLELFFFCLVYVYNDGLGK